MCFCWFRGGFPIRARTLGCAAACVFVVGAVAAVLPGTLAAAGACPAVAGVKAFHGYVRIDFKQTVGVGGTTVTLDHSTSVMHFSSLTPYYVRVGPRGHKRKVLGGFRSRGAKGVVSVADSYSSSSQNGTQTSAGPPAGGRLTIGTHPASGCPSARYAWAAGFTIATHSSGSWPTPPDRGVEIDAGSPMRATPVNLHLTGSATVKWYRGGARSSGAGFYMTSGTVGGGSQWEQEFSRILGDTGRPDATAYIQWAFEPNTPQGLRAFASNKPASVSPTKLVEFVQPTNGHVVRNGSIGMVIRTRNGARPTEVEVDGVNVTRLLRPTGKGTYSGQLRLGRGLHYGFDDANVEATGPGGRRGFDHTQFIVAKQKGSLLKLTSFKTDTAAMPVQAAFRLGGGSLIADATTRVFVNGQRADRAISRDRKRLLLDLDADDGLRFGANRVQIFVYETDPNRERSPFAEYSRTFNLPSDVPIASAGGDRTVTQDSFVQLHGRATMPPGSGTPSFRWKITSAPNGSHAVLRNASGSRPRLVPDRPGRYLIRVSVRGARTHTVRGTRAPAGGGVATAAQAADLTETGHDTATLTVQPDIPPVGLRLDIFPPHLLAGEDSVRLGGKAVPGTPLLNHSNINYVVLDRRTLEIKRSGSVSADLGGIQQLGTMIDGYSGSLDSLVVLNWTDEFSTANIDAERNAFDALLQKIGAQKLTDAQRQQISLIPDEQFGWAVGVAGAPAGSAFVNLPINQGLEKVENSGYLRLNGVTGKYDFVFTDPVEFDTETNGPPADNSPAQLTVKVGANTYTQSNPGGGVSGFHLVILESGTSFGSTLNLGANRVYVTNAADGAEQSGEVQRLANDLTSAADNPNRPLVFLQAFGTPHGADGPWGQAAKQIERLGGTRQVFNALNAVDPRTLNGEDANRRGPYAFVGRVNSSAPSVEQSYPLNGHPGRLQGALMRGRDGGYEPTFAAPPRSDGQPPVNTELIDVVNQAARPFPAFTDTTGAPVDPTAAQAVEKFLGGPDVTGLCSAAAPVCAIRKQYYEAYHADWSSIQDDLTNAQGKCAEQHQGFTAAQCEGIRSELRNEVSMVAKVTAYFGPNGLKQPFGTAGVLGQADLEKTSQEIQDAVKPPPTDNTTSSVLSTIGQVLFPTPTTPAPDVFAALSAAFSAVGYFTRDDGSPNLIGPAVATQASRLGVELAERYQQAANNLDDEGQLIVSDYGKLTTVASKVNAEPGPGEIDWRLGNVGKAENALRLAAQQTIYQRLVPLAYPVMYDLGQIDNARNWYCDSGYFFIPDKHLFADQPDSAQFVARFPETGWNPRIAVGQVHAVDHGQDARIPGIPSSIADKLFTPVVQDGLGLTKVEFYSPRNGFRYLPAQPHPPSLGRFADDQLSFDGLQEHPWYDSGDPILCDYIPDPPGNSG